MIYESDHISKLDLRRTVFTSAIASLSLRRRSGLAWGKSGCPVCFVRLRVCARCIVPFGLTNDGFGFLSCAGGRGEYCINVRAVMQNGALQMRFWCVTLFCSRNEEVCSLTQRLLDASGSRKRFIRLMGNRQRKLAVAGFHLLLYFVSIAPVRFIPLADAPDINCARIRISRVAGEINRVIDLAGTKTLEHHYTPNQDLWSRSNVPFASTLKMLNTNERCSVSLSRSRYTLKSWLRCQKFGKIFSWCAP